MSSTEDQVLKMIWDFGGEASISTIAKAVRVTPDYARLICGNLKRQGSIDFFNARTCYLKSKGRLEAARMKVQECDKKRKIVVGAVSSEVGFGENNKSHFVLGY